MSGPVTDTDAPAVEAGCEPSSEVELTPSRRAQVGAFEVRRALPRRSRRTVGPWCFLDHMGPAQVAEDEGLGVPPHPHIGLQTVTWLFAGEALHRDSLGNEQLLRPGQLNLMTAGRGVSHSEEGTGTYRGDLHGAQLWVAQPDATRHGDPAFEHHADLPRLDLGEAVATVLVGQVGAAASPARRDTEHMGADLELRGRAVVPLEPRFEYALVVASGAVEVAGRRVAPGTLAYLGQGRDELALSPEESSRALLVGGVPLDQPVLMWWNYVARTRDEITAAHRDWTERTGRFGSVASALPPVDVPPPPWLRPE